MLLSAGSLIPADGIVLEANDFFVNQAVLTGETFPVEKKPATVPANASLAERTNCVFMGTSVGSGTAQVLIVQTGKATVFGQIAERLKLRPPETEFERGIQHFGYLLTQVMLVMVVIVLAVNIFLAKPLLDSLLFALALAVGLTPELLPAIISITLSHGAQRDGQARRDRAPAELHRELRQHGRAVHRQDRHADRRCRSCSTVRSIRTGNHPTPFCATPISTRTIQTGLNNPLDEAIQAAAPEGRAGHQRRAKSRRNPLRLRAQAPECGRRQCPGRAHPHHQGRTG